MRFVRRHCPFLIAAASYAVGSFVTICLIWIKYSFSKDDPIERAVVLWAIAPSTLLLWLAIRWRKQAYRAWVIAVCMLAMLGATNAWFWHLSSPTPEPQAMVGFLLAPIYQLPFIGMVTLVLLFADEGNAAP